MLSGWAVVSWLGALWFWNRDYNEASNEPLAEELVEDVQSGQEEPSEIDEDGLRHAQTFVQFGGNRWPESCFMEAPVCIQSEDLGTGEVDPMPLVGTNRQELPELLQSLNGQRSQEAVLNTYHETGELIMESVESDCSKKNFDEASASFADLRSSIATAVERLSVKSSISCAGDVTPKPRDFTFLHSVSPILNTGSITNTTANVENTFWKQRNPQLTSEMQKLSIKQLLCVSRLPQNVIAAQSYRRAQGEVSQLTSLLRKNAKRLPLVPVVNAVSATSLHKVCHTVICSVDLRPQEFIDDTLASLAELRSSVATVIETYSDPSVNHDGDETPKPRTLVTRRLESLNELRDSQATVAVHTSSADLCPSRKDSVVKIDPCIDIVAAVQSLTRVEEMRLWKYIDRIILQMPSIVVPLPKNLINGLAGSVASFRSSHQNGFSIKRAPLLLPTNIREMSFMEFLHYGDRLKVALISDDIGEYIGALIEHDDFLPISLIAAVISLYNTGHQEGHQPFAQTTTQFFHFPSKHLPILHALLSTNPDRVKALISVSAHIRLISSTLSASEYRNQGAVKAIRRMAKAISEFNEDLDHMECCEQILEDFLRNGVGRLFEEMTEWKNVVREERGRRFAIRKFEHEFATF